MCTLLAVCLLCIVLFLSWYCFFFVGVAQILHFTCFLSFILIFVPLHISTSEFGLVNKTLNKGVVVFAL